MQLYENGEVVFDDKTVTSNLTIIMSASPRTTTLKFGSFEPIEITMHDSSSQTLNQPIQAIL